MLGKKQFQTHRETDSHGRPDCLMPSLPNGGGGTTKKHNVKLTFRHCIYNQTQLITSASEIRRCDKDV